MVAGQSFDAKAAGAQLKSLLERRRFSGRFPAGGSGGEDPNRPPRYGQSKNSGHYTELADAGSAQKRTTYDAGNSGVPSTASKADLCSQPSKTCGCCGVVGHTVSQCAMPHPDGMCHGCCICNASDHAVERCPLIALDTRDDKVRTLLEVVVVKRYNLPQVQNERGVSLLQYLVDIQGALTKNDDDVANYFAKHTPNIPWSIEFAKRAVQNPVFEGHLQAYYRSDCSLRSRLPRDEQHNSLVCHLAPAIAQRGQNDAQATQSDAEFDASMRTQLPDADGEEEI